MEYRPLLEDLRYYHFPIYSESGNKQSKQYKWLNTEELIEYDPKLKKWVYTKKLKKKEKRKKGDHISHHIHTLARKTYISHQHPEEQSLLRLSPSIPRIGSEH